MNKFSKEEVYQNNPLKNNSMVSVSEPNNPTVEEESVLRIPIIYARMCIQCGCVFNLKTSKYYEEHKLQFCSRKCYNKFTIIPREEHHPEIDSKKDIFIQRIERERKKMTAKLRFEILKRDKFRCVYCGKNPTESSITLHVDHLYPISKYGDTEIENLVTCCQECNSGKKNHLISEELSEEIKKRISENLQEVNKND